jgi:hypothetical protein
VIFSSELDRQALYDGQSNICCVSSWHETSYCNIDRLFIASYLFLPFLSFLNVKESLSHLYNNDTLKRENESKILGSNSNTYYDDIRYYAKEKREKVFLCFHGEWVLCHTLLLLSYCCCCHFLHVSHHLFSLLGVDASSSTTTCRKEIISGITA